MKALPLLTLVCAAQLVVPATFAATSYIAEGVDTSNILNSTRFYDNGKGYYWSTYPNWYYDMTGKNESTLGDLVDYFPDDGDATIDFADFSNLKDDKSTCWYQVTANMIQYWQTYYGVFAANPSALPYGHTYNKSYLKTVGGTQSLKVGMTLYDNFIDRSSPTISPAIDWYMKGTKTNGYLRTNAPLDGGFFSDYFSGSATVETGTTGKGLDFVLTQLKTAFGDLTTDESGELVRSTEGQIAYIGHYSHAVTCYGFELDDEGKLISLRVSDSDDGLDYGYTLRTVYLKEDSTTGNVLMYRDEACTNLYGSGSDYIDFVGYIDTPDELKAMYADYTSAETPLTWNGKLETWNSSYEEATTEKLPTTATGWEVYVDAGETAHDAYYATYYDPTRKVEFNDHAKYDNNAPTITVSGDIKAGGMVLSGKENNYTFTKDTTTGGSITLSGDITKTGSGTDTFSDIAVSANKLIVSNGTLTLAEGTEMTLAGGVLISAGELVIEDGNAFGTSGTEISIDDGGQLNVADNVELAATAITIVLDSVYKEKAAITGDGSFAAGTTLAIDGSLSALGISTKSVDEYSYLLWDNDSLALAVTLTGTLADSLAEAGWGYKINVDQGLLTLAIPEPSAFGLFVGLGALTLVVARRRRRK